MIRFIRTVRVKNGSKYGEAIGFAKEMVEFTKKYDGASDAKVFMDVAGAVGTIRWVADYPDLATVDKVQAQVLSDPDYWKAVAKAADLFIEGQVEDLLLREI